MKLVKATQKPKQQQSYTRSSFVEVPLNKLQAYYTFKPPFNNSKIYYMPLYAAPTVGQRYYLNSYPEIDNGKVIGIEFWNSDFLNPVVMNGVTFNIIDPLDVAQVQLSLYSKVNEPILYRQPLAGFQKQYVFNQRFEQYDFADIKIDTGQSFFEFTQSIWATVFPIAIPLRFIY